MTSTPEASSPRLGVWAWAAFALALLAYQLNGKALAGGDTVPLRYLPLSLLCGGKLDLDALQLARRSRLTGKIRTPYYLVLGKDRRHVYSTFGPFPSLLALPVYGVAAALSREFGYDRVLGLGKWSASLLVALAVVLLLLAFAPLVGPLGAFCLALAWGLGTSAWSMMSQAFWQHSAAAPCLAAALLCLVRGREPDGEAWIPPAAFFLAMATLCRPTNGWIALCFTCYVALHHRKLLARFLLYAALPALVLAWHNGAIFGSPFQFGQLLASKQVAAYKAQSGLFQFSSLGMRWLGVMFSPSRGIFVYSPFLLFGVAGLGWSLRKGGEPLYRWSLLAAGGIIALHGLWFDWWGGWTFGYRLPFDAVFLLVLGLCPLWAALRKSRPWWGGFVLALAFSVWVQVLGAFSYDLVSWNARPNVDQNPGRLWSVSDSQLLHYLQRPRWIGALQGSDMPRKTLRICPPRIVPQNRPTPH